MQQKRVDAKDVAFDLRPAGFETLVRAIVAQQVSAASARAIFARLCETVQPLTPSQFLAAGPEVARACGFSRPKIAYATALAEHILDGRLPIDRLPDMDDEAVIQALTAVPGIGVWSAFGRYGDWRRGRRPTATGRHLPPSRTRVRGSLSHESSPREMNEILN